MPCASKVASLSAPRPASLGLLPILDFGTLATGLWCSSGGLRCLPVSHSYRSPEPRPRRHKAQLPRDGVFRGPRWARMARSQSPRHRGNGPRKFTGTPLCWRSAGVSYKQRWLNRSFTSKAGQKRYSRRFPKRFAPYFGAPCFAPISGRRHGTSRLPWFGNSAPLILRRGGVEELLGLTPCEKVSVRRELLHP